MMKLREVIRAIEGNGWYFVGQQGSHRHKDPTKHGRHDPR